MSKNTGLNELERAYRADHESRLAELGPRVRDVIAYHTDEIGQSRRRFGMCCADEWCQFAAWVRVLPNDDPALALLATIPSINWPNLVDDYFGYTVGSDTFGLSAVNEWCSRRRWEPRPQADGRLLDLLLLDAVSIALAYPSDP